jgi:hypothetical protein
VVGSGSSSLPISTSFAVVKTGSVLIDSTNITEMKLEGDAGLIDVLGSVSITFNGVIMEDIVKEDSSSGLFSDRQASASDRILDVHIISSSFLSISSNVISSLNGGLYAFNGDEAASISFSKSNFNEVKVRSDDSIVDTACIFVDKAVNVFIIECEFDGVGNSSSGGAIHIENCLMVLITQSTFKSCEALLRGGALFFGYMTAFNITHSSFEECECLDEEGVGGAIFSESQVEGLKFIVDVIFTSNHVFDGRSNDIADNCTESIGFYSAESVYDCSSTSDIFKFCLLQHDIFLDCLIEVCFLYFYFEYYFFV